MTRILVCPSCLSALKFFEEGLKCIVCGNYAHIGQGIPRFTKPPFDKREYFFEMRRYRGIALKPLETYGGFHDSYPEARVEILKSYLRKKPIYLNVGQGFGQLEKSMPGKAKICLDQCIEFLQYCKSQEIPNTRYVMGFGERMPFRNDYFPAVVSNSVFQIVVDQREFLIENARVLKLGGLFMLTITYRWNYPRKPQSFPAENPELLKNFLRELGIDVEIQYQRLPDLKQCAYEDGDFMFVRGKKRA